MPSHNVVVSLIKPLPLRIHQTSHCNRLCRLPGLRLYLSCYSSINKVDAVTQLCIVIKLTMKKYSKERVCVREREK